MVITTSQRHSTKPVFRLCAGSDPARRVGGYIICHHFYYHYQYHHHHHLQFAMQNNKRHNELFNSDQCKRCITPGIFWKVKLNSIFHFGFVSTIVFHNLFKLLIHVIFSFTISKIFKAHIFLER